MGVYSFQLIFNFSFKLCWVEPRRGLWVQALLPTSYCGNGKSRVLEMGAESGGRVAWRVPPPPQIDGMGRVGAPTKRASAGGTSGTHHTALEAHFDLKSGVSQ